MVSWYVPGCSIISRMQNRYLDYGNEGGSERPKEFFPFQLGAEQCWGMS